VASLDFRQHGRTDQNEADGAGGLEALTEFVEEISQAGC
jgi:hypothetical protein